MSNEDFSARTFINVLENTYIYVFSTMVGGRGRVDLSPSPPPPLPNICQTPTKSGSRLMSSVPTMLITRLGCLLKHTYDFHTKETLYFYVELKLAKNTQTFLHRAKKRVRPREVSDLDWSFLSNQYVFKTVMWHQLRFQRGKVIKKCYSQLPFSYFVLFL
jgi:hypothetical protein